MTPSSRRLNSAAEKSNRAAMQAWGPTLRLTLLRLASQAGVLALLLVVFQRLAGGP